MTKRKASPTSRQIPALLWRWVSGGGGRFPQSPFHPPCFCGQPPGLSRRTGDTYRTADEMETRGFPGWMKPEDGPNPLGVREVVPPNELFSPAFQSPGIPPPPRWRIANPLIEAAMRALETAYPALAKVYNIGHSILPPMFAPKQNEITQWCWQSPGDGHRHKLARAGQIFRGGGSDGGT